MPVGKGPECLKALDFGGVFGYPFLIVFVLVEGGFKVVAGPVSSRATILYRKDHANQALGNQGL